MNKKKMEKLFEQFKASLEASEDDEEDLDDPVPSTSTGKRNYSSRPSERSKFPKRLKKEKPVDHFKKERKEERRKLFQSQTKAPNQFEKEIRCLAKRCLSIPVIKPVDTKILEKTGLWGRTVHFSEADDKNTVKFKIEQAFPEVKGGFKMLKSNKNGKQLFLIGDGPIVDGKTLKSVSARNIYLCPIQKDIEFTEDDMAQWSTDDECMEECLVCGKQMPITEMVKHAEKCIAEGKHHDSSFDLAEYDLGGASNSPDQEPPAELNTEALNKMFIHRTNIMEYTDIEAYASPDEKGNSLSVTRGTYVSDLIVASKNPVFLAKIKRPLMVTFIGEAGQDGGGLRKNLLSMVVDHSRDVFNTEQEEMAIDADDIDDLQFALSLFLGIAIVQEGLCPKFLIGVWKKHCVRHGRNFKFHPIKRGLALLNVDKLMEDQQILSLFVDIPVTVALILEILDNDSNPSNLEARMCQIISFNFFVDFLNNVSDGKVLAPPTSCKISLEEVYYFITGLKNVPVRWNSFKYKIKYQLNDTINRFRPLSNTCPGVAQLTLPIVEKYKDMEDGWIDGVLSLQHGFGRL